MPIFASSAAACVGNACWCASASAVAQWPYPPSRSPASAAVSPAIPPAATRSRGGRVRISQHRLRQPGCFGDAAVPVGQQRCLRLQRRTLRSVQRVQAQQFHLPRPALVHQPAYLPIRRHRGGDPRGQGALVGVDGPAQGSADIQGVLLQHARRLRAPRPVQSPPIRFGQAAVVGRVPVATARVRGTRVPLFGGEFANRFEHLKACGGVAAVIQRAIRLASSRRCSPSRTLLLSPQPQLPPPPPRASSRRRTRRGGRGTAAAPAPSRS